MTYVRTKFGSWQYKPDYAQGNTDRRHKEKNKQVKVTKTVANFIREKLQQKWSPDQISGYAKKYQLFSIGKEWIYQFILNDKKKGGKLYLNLRHQNKKYRKRYGSPKRTGPVKMSGKHTMKKKIRGKTNWDKVKSLTEKQIVSAAKSDPDAKPLTRAQLKKFKRVSPPKDIDVKAIRKKLQVSQKEFAGYFGVSVRTIQEWEQHRRTPTTIARNFLKVIEKAPKAVLKALAA